MNDDEPQELVDAKQLGKLFGTSGGKVLEWFHDGIIPAEVAEGRVYRFDAERVRLILKHRAAKRAEAELRWGTPSSYFPPEPKPEPTVREPYAYMAEYRAREAKKREDGLKKRGRREGK